MPVCRMVRVFQKEKMKERIKPDIFHLYDFGTVPVFCAFAGKAGQRKKVEILTSAWRMLTCMNRKCTELFTASKGISKEMVNNAS